MNFRDTIQCAKAMCLDDGVVTLEETAILLRLLRPFAEKGNPDARAIYDLLRRTREDGRITREESDEIIRVIRSLEPVAVTLETYVRAIADFPKPGALFRDVTGILDTAEAFNMALDEITRLLAGTMFDIVVAPESRGFIFGSAIAARLHKAFVPIRRPGKLPRETISESYDLECGRATLHMHADAVYVGERAVFVDDLLATGSTALAGARLVERLGGKVVKMIFPIELQGYGARSGALRNYDVATLVAYPGK